MICPCDVVVASPTVSFKILVGSTFQVVFFNFLVGRVKRLVVGDLRHTLNETGNPFELMSILVSHNLVSNKQNPYLFKFKKISSFMYVTFKTD